MLPEGVNVINLIRQSFDKNGISYWMDEEGIHSGETFASVISRNIAESKVFLFVSSANSNASRWTCGEIATANSYGKRIIPFKIDQASYDPSVTIYLAALDAIDYTTNPDRAIRRLIKSVKQYLADIEAETLLKEKEERARAERERIEREKAEIEEKVRTLDSRIDDLLHEKNQLLEEMKVIRSQITGLNNLGGEEPNTSVSASSSKAPVKKSKRWKKHD